VQTLRQKGVPCLQENMRSLRLREQLPIEELLREPQGPTKDETHNLIHLALCLNRLSQGFGKIIIRGLFLFVRAGVPEVGLRGGT
jgi:hypothetical protein